MLQLIGLFAALFAISFLAFMFFTRASKTEQATLKRAQHITTGKDADSESDLLLIASAPVDTAASNTGLRGTALVKHLELLIQQAALSMSVPVLFGLSFAGAVLAFLLSWMLIPILLVECIALSVGALLPYLYLRFKRERRLTAFDKALPGAMELISRAVKAGHSVQAAFEIAGQEAMQPVRSEFAVINGQVKFGLPQNEALLQMSARIPTQDLRFMVTAVLIQRQTGGSLPQVLDRTTHMIRERIRVAGELRIKTTQGRLSGIVLICMPFGLALVMKIISPSWLDPLITDPLGHMLLYYACASLAVGSLLVHIITKPEV